MSPHCWVYNPFTVTQLIMNITKFYNIEIGVIFPELDIYSSINKCYLYINACFF